MNRDGAKESLWQSIGPDYTAVNAWERETTYDALIVGGGITGLTTALLLQESGKRCVIAEAHNIGFGTSGGTTAHLNTMLDSPYNTIAKDFGKDGAKLMAKGARSAIDLIEGLVSKYEIDCGFSYQPGYLFANDDKQAKELDEIRKGAMDAGVTVSEVEGIPVPLPFTKAVRFELQAQILSTPYLYGLAKAFESLGGVILQHCTVQDTKDEKDVFIADTTLGEIKAGKLVYASHIPPGINILHFRCAPYRSYAMAVTLTDHNYPDGLAYDLDDPYHYFRTAEMGGQRYLIAGGFDHKNGHEENTEACFRTLEAYIRTHYAVDEVAYEWSSMYFNASDGLPYIGLLPGHDNAYVGTGYSGNGMTLGTLAAKVICELVSHGESEYENLLKPNRVKPMAGFAEFVKENASVVSDFISKRFQYEKISTLAALAPGEATLAEWEGKKVGLYKDEAGKIHGVDPVCPHAKCIVAWNSAEKSWDCPCHGARFSPDGELLSGPARHSLTPIVWEGIDGD